MYLFRDTSLSIDWLQLSIDKKQSSSKLVAKPSDGCSQLGFYYID